MHLAIVDCYTDEPSGLGVPPFLGVYPRYIAGEAVRLGLDFSYLRIDDLRLAAGIRVRRAGLNTNPLVANSTLNAPHCQKILNSSHLIVVVAGIHTPGKYLNAVPASLKEVSKLLSGYKAPKVLSGPAALGGSMQTGGGISKQPDLKLLGFSGTLGHEGWDKLEGYLYPSKRLPEQDLYSRLREPAILGARLIRQIGKPIVAEIETGMGCPRINGCSFCMEPLKGKPQWRNQCDIIDEVKALKDEGVEHFRLGKQADFYSYKGGTPNEIEALLKPLALMKPNTLHIDNVDPCRVCTKEGESISRLIVKFCSPGNVAALGIESFDSEVICLNNLNSTPEQALDAIRAINRIGAERGENGMPRYLPGVNLILGLPGETSATLQTNLIWLKKILDEGLMVRRINIRQVAVYPGTKLAREGGIKHLKKNKRLYYKFRETVRQEIDHEMLKRVVPTGTILRDVLMECHRGNNTFGRQLGTYPLIVGVKQRLELGKFFGIRVTGHMLRSVIGEPVSV